MDARWTLGGPPGIEAYARGHLPDASYVDLDGELAGPPGPGRHPLPPAAAFQAAMRRHGVSGRRPVVVYDAAAGVAAARAWWTLRYFGHPDVRVLDGGYAAWVAGGHEVSRAEARPTEGDFVAEAGHMSTLDAAEAGSLARSGVLLDARAPERFRGDVEPIDPVPGHIPGARNVPTTANVDETGHFLPPAALLDRFQGAGVTPGAEVGAYCGSGVTAAHEVLALAVAGIDASLYVGSWSEWITDRGRPVATGGA